MTDEWPEMSVPANTRVIANTVNDARTEFNDLTVVDRTNQVDLSSEYPLSERNDIFTTGVSHIAADSKYRIRANASTESLETVERLRYIPGYMAEAGIALQIPEAPTGDQEVRWGYWDGSDGAYFGWDSTDLFIETQRGGTRQGKVYKEDWSGSTHDGFEQNLKDGVVTRLILALYDYGHVRFQMFQRNKDREISSTNLHRESPLGNTTLSKQNLPIRVEVDNPDTTDFDVFVGGRQMTIRGQFDPTARLNGEFRTDVSLSGTTWVPIMSLRKKAAFDNIGAGFFDVDVIATEDVFLQIRSDAGSTTDTDYQTPSNTDAGETAVEVDLSPTASITDGFKRYSTIFKGGTGAQSTVGQVLEIDLEYKRERPVTYFMRTTGAAGGTLDAIQTNWREQW